MSDTTDLISRLRNTPNWLREAFGDWKTATSVYDRAPFEAADALTAQAATIAEQARELAALRAALQEADTCMGHEDYDTEWRDKWAHLWAGKVVTPDTDKCRKCNGNMRPGTYLAQTMTGIPDFPGDRHAVTVSPGGPGWLAECLKCDVCGHSVTGGKAVTP